MIMSSADIYVLSSLDALYFSCVIAFLELLIHCWMEMVRADIFVMFLILERKFLVFQLLLCMYVIWGIFIDVLCQFEEILFFPLVCWVFLSWKLLDFVKCFFLCQLIWSYNFSSLACWHVGLNLLISKCWTSLKDWNKSHLVMILCCFVHHRIQFANILLRIFPFNLMRDLVLVFSFPFYCCFVWFWYQGDPGLIN